MKRRFLCIFVATVLFFGCVVFNQKVQAKDFSLSDLSIFGIPGMKVQRSDGAVCDGVISENEYAEGTSFRDESGLYLFMNGKFYNGKLGSSSVKQENFVVLSDDEILCALRLRLDRSMLGEIVKDGKSCYRVSFSFGLTPGDHPAQRGSLLTNTYYFSTSDRACIGFTGERKARSVTEDSVASKPLSSYVPSYRDNGIVLPDGSKWTSDHYCKNASFSLVENGSFVTMSVEARIPLEDALLSVHPSQRDEVRNSLKDNNGTLCGGLATSVDLNAYSSLVTGLPVDHPAVFSSEDASVRTWIKQNCEIPASGLFIPEVIPIPLYWCGEVPTIVDTDLKNVESVSPSSDGSPAVTSSVTVPPETTSLKTDVIPDVSSRDIQAGISENDESIFDALPNGDELVPEDTEIVYDAKSTTKEEEKKYNSLASSILATVSGAFIFASVMVLCMYFRDSNKKTEESGAQNKRKKKKNSNKGKNNP